MTGSHCKTLLPICNKSHQEKCCNFGKELHLSFFPLGRKDSQFSLMTIIYYKNRHSDSSFSSSFNCEK